MLSKLRKKLRVARTLKSEYRDWSERHYAGPSPVGIKSSILSRYSNANVTWVETGTFMGDTAAMLALSAKAVYTIEPDEKLSERARERFKDMPSVHPLEGTSENLLPNLLPTLSGAINFWLDGHFSGGITFQGVTDCPVRDELHCIETNLHRYSDVYVLIDDMRCFDPSIAEYCDYPDLNYLVDWARKNNFKWSIEHDIFIAHRKT